MVKKKKQLKKNSLPKGLRMSKKEVREYQKKISKKKLPGVTISPGVLLLVASAVVFLLAKYSDSYEMFNILMAGAGVLLLFGLMNLVKN